MVALLAGGSLKRLTSHIFRLLIHCLPSFGRRLTSFILNIPGERFKPCDIGFAWGCSPGGQVNTDVSSSRYDVPYGSRSDL
jgi:hypothetical protein